MQNLDNDKLTKNIIDLMKATNTTQAKLSDAIGISQSSLCKSLSHKSSHRFTVDQLFKIAQYFDISVDFLLGSERPKTWTEYEICEFLTRLIEKRQLVCTKSFFEEDVLSPYKIDQFNSNTHTERTGSEYVTFHFPNYKNLASRDQLTETEISERRDKTLIYGNSNLANQNINNFFNQFLPTYERYLDNQLTKELFLKITEKLLEELK